MPSKRRATPDSAWKNGSPICFEHVERHASAGVLRPSQRRRPVVPRADTSTAPPGLGELDCRSQSDCRGFVRSPSGSATSSEAGLRPASTRHSAIGFSIASCRLDSTASSSTAPRSSGPERATSGLRSVSGRSGCPASPEVACRHLGYDASAACWSGRASFIRRSANPRIADSGVRSSWLRLLNSWAFARSAASARAVCSAELVAHQPLLVHQVRGHEDRRDRQYAIGQGQ